MQIKENSTIEVQKIYDYLQEIESCLLDRVIDNNLRNFETKNENLIRKYHWIMINTFFIDNNAKILLWK